MSDTEDREGSEGKESARDDEEVNGKARSRSSSRSKSRSKSRSRSKSKSRSRSYTRSPARSYSRSRSHTPYSRSHSRSHSRSRSRSKTRSNRKHRSYSRSHSRSPHYRKRRKSTSPFSNRKRHVGNRDAPETSRCLGIFGLSLYTTERDLRSHFEKYGSVQSIQIVYDRQSGRSRGFAFVYYDTVDGAEEAKERTNGLEIDGRRIRVDYSITKRAHTPTPGVYMGKPSQHRDRRNSYDDYGGKSSSHRDSYRDSYRDRNHRERDYHRGSYSHYSRSRSRSYSPRRY